MVNIKKIKKEILYKAFHGELIESDSKNGNAKDLITEIKSKLKNKIDEVSAISDSFELFDIPENWQWCRLCDIGDTNIGLTYHPENISDNGTVVLRSNNIKNNKLVFDDTIAVDIKVREKQYLNKNDILICSRNGSKPLIGKCGIYNGELGKVSFGAFMAVYRTVCYKYVYYYFTTDIFRRYFDNDDTKQINQVTQDILKFAMIPLPPLKEQELIVNKIDKLFNLLDLISKNQDTYIRDKKCLWLKIIEKGISGHLTEHLKSDGSAEDLYNDIIKEKEKLIKQGIIKKNKTLLKITEDEIPFDIPKNWKFVRFGECCIIATGKKDANYSTEDGEYDFFTCSLTPLKSPTYSFDGEYIIAPGNGINVGKTIYYNGQFEAYQRTYVIKAISTNIYMKFLKYVMDSKWEQYNIDKMFGSATPFIKLGNLENFVIPLPPLAEQKRIVEKLDALIEK